MKKIAGMLLAAFAALCLAACVPEGPQGETPLEKLDVTDANHLNRFGRTYVQNELLYFNHTASGFEVSFSGTRLDAVLVTSGFENEKNSAYVSVFVDGETDPRAARLLVLYEAERTYALAENLSEGRHTVRVLKRSETLMSDAALKSLSTDGAFYTPPAVSGRRIEVYGDSVTCGYGNMASSASAAFDTLEEDGLATYATLAARMLGADCSVIAASGWAMNRNVWNDTAAIPFVYDKTDFSRNPAPWDFSVAPPQAVVIALGANDGTYINSLKGEDKETAKRAYVERYLTFIEDIAAAYGDIPVVLCYGMMGVAVTYPLVEEVAAAAKAEGRNAAALQLPALNPADGIGAGHPGLKTHIRAAELLAGRLTDALGWEKVQENIAAE